MKQIEEYSLENTDKNLRKLLTRDTHIGVGIINKMDDENFDGEERAFFCWLMAYYFGAREK